MVFKRYSIKESLNRLWRSLTGDMESSDTPDVLDGLWYSEDEVFSMFAEMLQDSYPGYALALPFSNHTAQPTGTPLTLGGWLYAANGALYWYGSSGTITTLAGS